jgi:hypothetical protein
MNKISSLLTGLSGLVSSVSAQAPYQMELSQSPDIAITSFIGFVPRENVTNLAQQSATWVPASANWINVLRFGEINRGTGYEAVGKQSMIDYQWMVVSNNFRSWAAGLTTEPQYGNRAAISMHAKSLRAGVTFQPSTITMNLRAYKHSFAAGWTQDIIDRNADFSEANYFRLRMEAGPDGVNGTPDDTMAQFQDLSLATTSFLYGGLMAGFGAFGAGDNGQQLTNVLNYCVDNHIVLRIAITVPYLDNGTPKVLSTAAVFIPWGMTLDSEEPGPALSVDVANGQVTLGTGPANELYLVEQSGDLLNWTPIVHPELGKATPTVLMFDKTKPRNFFRSKKLVPTSTPVAAGMRFLRSMTSSGKPTDDSSGF